MIGRIAAGLIIGILALGLIGCGTQSRLSGTPSSGHAGDLSNFRLLVSD